MDMPLHPTGLDMALRLILTLCAGAAVGLNRESHGKAAGLRTTVLVGLAAAICMIQANILLGTLGKTPQSFGVMDLLRFPLGVLTGVGFIGAGAILRKGDLITGVTTAATLWIMTAIGLAFGGGQIWLDIIGTLLTLGVLQLLKRIDERTRHQRHALVSLDAETDEPPDLDASLKPIGCRAAFRGLYRSAPDKTTAFRFEVSWKHAVPGKAPTELLEAIERHGTIRKFEIDDPAS